LRSPDKEYSIRLADTTEDYVYQMNIRHGRKKIGSYRFEGLLVSAFWSPSGKYVAVNSHDGHRNWLVWVISLDDGSIVKSDGKVTRENTGNYDRGLDYGYLPDIMPAASRAIGKLYPGYADDHMREGYISIAYGWEKGDRLLMFHELVFGDLAEEKNKIIDVYTKWNVNGKLVLRKDEIKSGTAIVKDPWGNLPQPIKSTLDFPVKPAS
jgi:hypothetical protein